jgi:fatty-acyl-CoA synthase
MSLVHSGLDARAPGRGESAVKAWVRALEMTAPIAAHPQRVFPVLVDELADTLADSPALLCESQALSYRGLAERSNRISRWALAQNLAKGDVVCLFMPNQPDYMAIWLGISAVGGVASLLNTNLRDQSLAHCIDIVAPKHVVVAAEMMAEFATALPHLATRPVVWSHGESDGPFAPIDREIEGYAGDRLSPFERRRVSIEDRALHIYTSGTTGLPKAANVSHYRIMQWSLWFAGMMGSGPGDRMYNCLPMYHSVGGVVATGAVLAGGGSVLIRDKFSARRFWDDIVTWDCTLFQYIGELCRYLLKAPAHPRETAHRLRLCCGNGLRGDVWQDFEARFRIPRILEFYAATEGNVSLYNVEGKPGAIGRMPSFLAHRFPTALVKLDPDTEQPARNGSGHCIRCPVGEVGEAIGQIRSASANVGNRFEGYTSTAASESKIVRDVFEPGDAWFRTGDLMRMDASGYFYFVDRIGDTYRWKGENVSTAEVAETIARFPGTVDVDVYGVPVPGADGKAGMAAIVVETGFDLGALRTHIMRCLPAYARPLFLRIQGEIAVTATFKHKKSDLAREGYDPTAVADAIYFDDAERQAFVRLDQALYERIERGDQRL